MPRTAYHGVSELNIRVEADFERLAKALGLDVKRVGPTAELIARAGAREALAQATGEAVFSSISDLRSFRIFCLFTQGMTVDQAEDLVARVFQVPLATAKRLVDAALARYKIDLDAEIAALEKRVLDSAIWLKKAERWEMTIPPVLLVSILDRAQRSNQPDPMRAGTAYVWRFPDETYQAVRQASGLSSRNKP